MFDFLKSKQQIKFFLLLKRLFYKPFINLKKFWVHCFGKDEHTGALFCVINIFFLLLLTSFNMRWKFYKQKNLVLAKIVKFFYLLLLIS